MPKPRTLLALCAATTAVGVFGSTSSAAAAWLPPVAISEPGEHAGVPHVVLDAAGDATAVWDRWNGDDTVVESAYRPAGEGWGAPVDLSEPELSGEIVPGANDAQSPSIAVDGAGDVTVVWERYDGDKLLAQAVERPAGGEWSAPVDLGEAPLAADIEPWVAVDPSGDAITVWKRGEVIQSAYRPAGEAWESPIAVSGEESFVPQAAMNAAGDATVVWMRDTGGRFVVESAFRPVGGEWGAPTLVSEPDDPQIAIDALGDTLVAWRGEEAWGGEFVRTAYRAVGGSWQAPRDASNPGEEVQSIQDAVDPDGDAIVAWAGDGGQLGEYDTVHAAFSSDDSGAWGEPAAVQSEGGNGFPQDLVFDQSGNAAMVSERELPDGSSWAIEAVYRPFGGDWEEAVTLSEAGTTNFDPAVVLDAPGDATAADGDATAVWLTEGRHACPEFEGPKEDCREVAVESAGYDPEGLAVELEVPESAEVGETVPIAMAHAGLFSPQIDFGDGEAATAATTSHVYEEAGEYEVSGTGTEVLGYDATGERTIKIVPEGGGGTAPGGSGDSPPTTTAESRPEPTEPTSSSAGATSETHLTAPPGGGLAHAECTSARSRLRAERRRLRSHPSKHLRLELKKTRRLVAAAC